MFKMDIEMNIEKIANELGKYCRGIKQHYKQYYKDTKLYAYLLLDDIKYNLSVAYEAIRRNPTARRAAYITFFTMPVAGISIIHQGCGDIAENAEESTPPECNDHIDNDADFDIDYPEDPGCKDLYDNSEES
ncbi:MAG: hypothetical protein N3D84_01240 [Candidatus Woesearchaeota archaeon]|nr:hypothetical protein [Candidatus Woesearchaeota archaeon]